MTNDELKRKQRETWLLFRRVFGTADGVRVLEWLKAEVRFGVPVFMSMDKEDRIDTHLAAYRDGRKSVVLQILKMMEKPKFLEGYEEDDTQED